MNKGLVYGVAVVLTVVTMTAHSGESSSRRYQPPRLADGTPDLQGVWTNQTATPMERAAELGTRRAFTDAEAAAITAQSSATSRVPTVSSAPWIRRDRHWLW